MLLHSRNLDILETLEKSKCASGFLYSLLRNQPLRVSPRASLTSSHTCVIYKALVINISIYKRVKWDLLAPEFMLSLMTLYCHLCQSVSRRRQKPDLNRDRLIEIIVN